MREQHDNRINKLWLTLEKSVELEKEEQFNVLKQLRIYIIYI